MTGQWSRVRLWWARIRRVQLVWEGREADIEGEGHRELNYTGIIHHFLGHFSLTRSQNASFRQTYESAQIICDPILWTASQVIADSSDSLVTLTKPRESSPLMITCFSGGVFFFVLSYPVRQHSICLPWLFSVWFFSVSLSVTTEFESL